MCAHACVQSCISGIVAEDRFLSRVRMCASGSGWRSASLSRPSTLVLKRVSGKVSPLQVNIEHLPVPALTDNIAPHRRFPCSASSGKLRICCGS